MDSLTIFSDSCLRGIRYFTVSSQSFCLCYGRFVELHIMSDSARGGARSQEICFMSNENVAENQSPHVTLRRNCTEMSRGAHTNLTNPHGSTFCCLNLSPHFMTLSIPLNHVHQSSTAPSQYGKITIQEKSWPPSAAYPMRTFALSSRASTTTDTRRPIFSSGSCPLDRMACVCRRRHMNSKVRPDNYFMVSKL